MALMGGCVSVSPKADFNIVKAQAWRIDSQGQDTLQDVQSATDWQTLSGWKSWGFGPEAIWVKVELQAAAPDALEPWIVRVRPPFLDYVTLYDPVMGVQLKTGDALPPSEHSLPSINFTLQIPALARERTIYLQLRSASARALQVEVLPYIQAQQLDRLQEWLVGLATAISAIFFIWASIQWWMTRDRVIGAFAIKQVFATTWAFFILGFARIVIGPWLPEGVLTSLASTAFIWIISSTLWFFSILFEGYEPSRLALRSCRVMVAVLMALPLLQWLGLTTHLMLDLGNKSVLFGFVLLLVTLVTAVPKRVKQPIPLSALLCYMVIYGALNSMPPLIHLGWIQESSIVLYTSLAHAVLDGVVMFVMLQMRNRALQQEQQQVALDLQRSQQEAEIEKRQRDEQSRLFAMLAHEVKTPLATLRMWMDAGQLKRETVERAIFDMNTIIERCVQTGQLADRGLKPHVQTISPQSLTLSCIASCRAPERVRLVASERCNILQTDAQMLSIALSNLLDNACKYGAPEANVQVLLQPANRDGQDGWLWEIDSIAGPAGLPDSKRLFEKYYRSSRAQRLSGSGLGLFLVKGLLDLMHGSIRYEARDDHAVFSLWVPEVLELTHFRGRVPV